MIPVMLTSPPHPSNEFLMSEMTIQSESPWKELEEDEPTSATHLLQLWRGWRAAAAQTKTSKLMLLFDQLDQIKDKNQLH